jgi:hypothetical protein
MLSNIGMILRIDVELQLLEDLLEFMRCSWRTTYDLRGGVVINHDSGCARAARCHREPRTCGETFQQSNFRSCLDFLN